MVSIDLKDWKEVTKGIYVNPISANAAYEIHIKILGYENRYSFRKCRTLYCRRLARKRRKKHQRKRNTA